MARRCGEPTAPSTRSVASASGVPARSAAATIASACSAEPIAATMSEPHSSASSGVSTSASTIRASVSTAARVSAGEARANTASSSESPKPDPTGSSGGCAPMLASCHGVTESVAITADPAERTPRGPLGNHAPAAGNGPRRTARDRRRAARPRLHRRLVGRGQRHRCVHAPDPGRAVVRRVAPGHGHRPRLHPRAGRAGDERRDAGRPRAGPLRVRHRHLVPGHRGAVERDRVCPALPARPGHAAVPAQGAGRGEGHREVPDVPGHRVPARGPAGEPARAGARRAAPADDQARRGRGRRRDHELAVARRRAEGARGGRARTASWSPGSSSAPRPMPRSPGPSAGA